MKRLFCLVFACIMVISLSACGKEEISTEVYDEVSKHVKENITSLKPTEETQFYNYREEKSKKESVHYGYYYNNKNEIMLPEFYDGDDLEKIQGDIYEGDNGIYFGKPNSDADWCYIKMIAENWYYYEMHLIK